MRDLEDDFTGDYKGRDLRAALEEAKQMVMGFNPLGS